MSIFSRVMFTDWCHICGKRNDENVNIHYPDNAEHTTTKQHQDIKFNHNCIRICKKCAEKVIEKIDTTEFV